MVKRMKLWVAGALLLAVAGTVVASNMAFKFVPNINEANKVFTLSLPLNNNYLVAHDVFNDINASCPGSAQIVEKITPSAGGKLRRTWNNSGDDFQVLGEEGLLITVNPTCTQWVVVGSHNPSQVMSFAQAGKMYLTSIPYHTTAVVAHDIFNSIPSASIVEKITPSPGGKLRRTWNNSGDDFPVVIGDSYLIVVSAASSWTPPHY